MSTILEVNNLTTSFPGASGAIPVVDDVSLSIDEGEVLALVGDGRCRAEIVVDNVSVQVTVGVPPTVDTFAVTLSTNFSSLSGSNSDSSAFSTTSPAPPT